jgi:hypothetical protein
MRIGRTLVSQEAAWETMELLRAALETRYWPLWTAAASCWILPPRSVARAFKADEALETELLSPEPALSPVRDPLRAPPPDDGAIGAASEAFDIDESSCSLMF